MNSNLPTISSCIRAIVLLLLWTQPAYGEDWPQTIEVFIRGTPQLVRDMQWAERNGCEVQLRDVAAIDQLESQLTQRIVDDVSATVRIIERQLENLDSNARQNAIEASVSRAAAQAYGVRVFPTIVIDRRYRFDGEADIRAAVNRWRALSKE